MIRKRFDQERFEIVTCLIIILVARTSLTDSAPLQDSSMTDLQNYSDGCYYNYNHYNEGDRILTNEPCLNCTCHSKMLMCYLRVCPFTKPIGHDCVVEKREDQCCPTITCPEVPVELSHQEVSSIESSTEASVLGRFGCYINNKFYPEGVQVPSDINKPCELCYCIKNRTSCLMQECTLHIEGCVPVYPRGACCPISYNCDRKSEVLELEDSSFVTTTTRPTTGFILPSTMESFLSADCQYDGKNYNDGAHIKSNDSCKHCYCMRGDIVCAVQECEMHVTDSTGKSCEPVPPLNGECCPSNYVCNEIDFSTKTHELTTFPLKEIDSSMLYTTPARYSGQLHGLVSQEDVLLQEHINYDAFEKDYSTTAETEDSGSKTTKMEETSFKREKLSTSEVFHNIESWTTEFMLTQQASTPEKFKTEILIGHDVEFSRSEPPIISLEIIKSNDDILTASEQSAGRDVLGKQTLTPQIENTTIFTPITEDEKTEETDYNRTNQKDIMGSFDTNITSYEAEKISDSKLSTVVSEHENKSQDDIYLTEKQDKSPPTYELATSETFTNDSNLSTYVKDIKGPHTSTVGKTQDLRNDEEISSLNKVKPTTYISFDKNSLYSIAAMENDYDLSVEKKFSTTKPITSGTTVVTETDEDEFIGFDVKQHSIPSAIPGEGDCLINNNTYINNSFVPASNECEISCVCSSSMVVCKRVECILPENTKHCFELQRKQTNRCCAHVCDIEDIGITTDKGTQFFTTNVPIGDNNIEEKKKNNINPKSEPVIVTPPEVTTTENNLEVILNLSHEVTTMSDDKIFEQLNSDRTSQTEGYGYPYDDNLGREQTMGFSIDNDEKATQTVYSTPRNFPIIIENRTKEINILPTYNKQVVDVSDTASRMEADLEIHTPSEAAVEERQTTALFFDEVIKEEYHESTVIPFIEQWLDKHPNQQKSNYSDFQYYKVNITAVDSQTKEIGQISTLIEMASHLPNSVIEENNAIKAYSQSPYIVGSENFPSFLENNSSKLSNSSSYSQIEENNMQTTQPAADIEEEYSKKTSGDENSIRKTNKEFLTKHVDNAFELQTEQENKDSNHSMLDRTVGYDGDTYAMTSKYEENSFEGTSITTTESSNKQSLLTSSYQDQDEGEISHSEKNVYGSNELLSTTKNPISYYDFPTETPTDDGDKIYYGSTKKETSMPEKTVKIIDDNIFLKENSTLSKEVLLGNERMSNDTENDFDHTDLQTLISQTEGDIENSTIISYFPTTVPSLNQDLPDRTINPLESDDSHIEPGELNIINAMKEFISSAESWSIQTPEREIEFELKTETILSPNKFVFNDKINDDSPEITTNSALNPENLIYSTEIYPTSISNDSETSSFILGTKEEPVIYTTPSYTTRSFTDERETYGELIDENIVEGFTEIEISTIADRRKNSAESFAATTLISVAPKNTEPPTTTNIPKEPSTKDMSTVQTNYFDIQTMTSTSKFVEILPNKNKYTLVAPKNSTVSFSDSFKNLTQIEKTIPSDTNDTKTLEEEKLFKTNKENDVTEENLSFSEQTAFPFYQTSVLDLTDSNETISTINIPTLNDKYPYDNGITETFTDVSNIEEQFGTPNTLSLSKKEPFLDITDKHIMDTTTAFLNNPATQFEVSNQNSKKATEKIIKETSTLTALSYNSSNLEDITTRPENFSEIASTRSDSADHDLSSTTANVKNMASTFLDQSPSTQSSHYPLPSYGHIPAQYPTYSEDEYTDEDESELFGPGTCRYGGKLFVSAQQIPRDDPCDFCFCFRSDIICLQQSCPPPISGCNEEPINGFCCPRYECPVSMANISNITTRTTTTSTTLPPHFLSHAYKSEVKNNGCHIQGKSYRVGDKIDSASGPCLFCTCGGDGQMKCDPKTCSPEPMMRQMIAVVASRRR